MRRADNYSASPGGAVGTRFLAAPLDAAQQQQEQQRQQREGGYSEASLAHYAHEPPTYSDFLGVLLSRSPHSQGTGAGAPAID